ncbi:tho complex subunit 7 domain-containing protein [Ophiocordyceps camponoti-floridani]|uniref:Tho complex subunit 7 domain-containing protein n=1 Tax=Ophiocordyceps camponoti-floridani TaxID=2030778 RepID=A0A8H4Q2M7_9HYPO|nr:tho complex subunit 7 domain-containing protein [Ophiocordyceps camponoti-floridani]
MSLHARIPPEADIPPPSSLHRVQNHSGQDPDSRPTANLGARESGLAADDRHRPAKPDFASSTADSGPSQTSLAARLKRDPMPLSSLDSASPPCGNPTGVAADSTLQRSKPFTSDAVSASISDAGFAHLSGSVAPSTSGGLSHTFPHRQLSTPLDGVAAASLPAGRFLPLPRLSRSISDDAVISSPLAHSTSHSLRQQLSFLIEAWMADRESCGKEKQAAEAELSHLREAFRGDREKWTSDRLAMGRELDTMRAQVHRLEVEMAALKTATSSSASGGHAKPSRSRHQHLDGCSGMTGNSSLSDSDDAAAGSLSSNPSQQSNNSFRAYIFSPPVGPSGAPPRAHFATPGSSRTSPSGAALSSHAIRGPRSGQQATMDFLDPLGANGTAVVPVIDVHELDPNLDGIPIKANAVQKWTFSSAPNQRHSASPGRGVGTYRVRRQLGAQNRRSVDRGRISRDRQTSRDQTLQVLAVEESRRLTMHAGHTPNHSISILPPLTVVGGESDGPTHSLDRQADMEASRVGGKEATQKQPPDDDDDGDDDDDQHDQHEEEVVADDGHLDQDKPLRGPLMVKNIPAQDDLFFAQLDQKLESVMKSGQDSLPSVLRTPSPAEPAVHGCLRLDGAHHEPEDDVDDGAVADDEDIEPDVPLRLRSTANFGAPFGST